MRTLTGVTLLLISTAAWSQSGALSDFLKLSADIFSVS